MWVRLAPVSNLSISIVKCEALPMATEPNENLFGLALDFCTSSGTVLMPAFGLTTRYCAPFMAMVTGTRSFSGSKGMVLNSVGLIAIGPL
jgi:hypothetical protein